MKNKEYSEVRISGEEEEKVHSTPNYVAYTALNRELKHAFCARYFIKQTCKLSKAKAQNWEHNKVRIMGGEEEEAYILAFYIPSTAPNRTRYSSLKS